MMGFWLLMMAASAAFTPIRVYEGTWKLVSAHTMAGEGKPDMIVNHCYEGSAFYACEQVVNGKPVVLLVFTATEDPTKFHSQPVLPDGHAVGRGDLTIVGDHWTFSGGGKDDNGKETFYRTENFFTGRDKIHFEQYESGDNKTWVKKNEGNEVRVQ
ncbi:MAG TPA: hypothetical protein VH117_12320 [Edaphobacter sp.]|jgi:hypothetical protein|nr:hypothetical protein [Edaphobacter sp.]